MKSTLLFLILLPVFGLGQKAMISTSEWADARKAQRNEMVITPIPKYDTIKVMMLVCDTSDVNWGGVRFSFADDEPPFKKSSHVWWQFGYEIRCSKKVGESGDHVFYSAHVPCEYLDRHKKPLPKSTIVWLTKPINQ